MPAPELCSEPEVRRLVEAFYARVRADAVLAPIFESRIADWQRHTETMVAFWSSVLCGSKRYRGTPVAAHSGLPTLTAELFRRWMRVFRETTAAQPNQRLGRRANHVAERIVESLWCSYRPHQQAKTPAQGAARK
jgi:hemoglobin